MAENLTDSGSPSLTVWSLISFSLGACREPFEFKHLDVVQQATHGRSCIVEWLIEIPTAPWFDLFWHGRTISNFLKFGRLIADSRSPTTSQ